MKKTRLPNIELLRFIFCICIVLKHSNMCMPGGYLGVEFFFVLSGAFICKSISESSDSNTSSPVQNAYKYSKKRLLAIYPYYFVSCIIGFLINNYFEAWDKICVARRFFYMIGDFLLLQCEGFPVLSATGIVWYLSSLFPMMWMTYFLVDKYRDKYAVHVAPIIGVFGIGLLVETYQTLDVTGAFLGPVNTGIIRAFAELNLGVFSYVISKKLKEKKTISNGLLTIIEILIYAFIIVYMAKQTSNQSCDGYIAIAMMIAVSLSIRERNAFNRVIPAGITLKLGKLSSILFMNHYYWGLTLDRMVFKGLALSDNEYLMFFFVASLCTTVVVLIIGNCLKKIKWRND